jgi:hypothetical protein
MFRPQLYTIKISLEGLAGRLATPILSRDVQKMNELNRLYEEMQDLIWTPRSTDSSSGRFMSSIEWRNHTGAWGNIGKDKG